MTSWAEEAERHDAGEDAPVSQKILYKIVDSDTKNMLNDFSPAVETLCNAVDKAHREYRILIDGLVESIRSGKDVPEPSETQVISEKKFFVLVSFYTTAFKRFAMSMRGTLKLMLETGIGESKDVKTALTRVSKIQDAADIRKRLDVRVAALALTDNETKMRNAKNAHAAAMAAEAQCYRKLVCVMFGKQQAVDGGKEMWIDAEKWAVVFLDDNGERVMERMRTVFSGILSHKRAIEWEIDSSWMYRKPARDACRLFVGGTPGTHWQ